MDDDKPKNKPKGSIKPPDKDAPKPSDNGAPNESSKGSEKVKGESQK